jgi:hypothetical protein
MVLCYERQLLTGGKHVLSGTVLLYFVTSEHCHNGLLLDQFSNMNMKRSIMRIAWSSGLTTVEPDSIRTKGEYEAFDDRNPPRRSQASGSPNPLFFIPRAQMTACCMKTWRHEQWRMSQSFLKRTIVKHLSSEGPVKMANTTVTLLVRSSGISVAIFICSA